MPTAWAGHASRGRREGGSLLFQAASPREAEAHPQRVPRAGASAWERCELPQAPVSRHQQRSTTGQRSSFLWKEGQEPGWRGSGSGTSSRGGRESCQQLSPFTSLSLATFYAQVPVAVLWPELLQVTSSEHEGKKTVKEQETESMGRIQLRCGDPHPAPDGALSGQPLPGLP